MVFYIKLPNFPEWAIPMTKVVPMVYTEDAYDLTKVTWSVNCYHIWHVENSGTPQVSVELRVDFTASGTIPNPINPTSPTAIPVYVDIDLVFLNERVATQINTNKS